ncbi:hypothetical protein [Intestinibacter sp.]|uniref:hypothetical protein n=1 Tax=Intestinibacter sp. TaxID=1965304 RepID=UPI003F142A70
MYNNGDFDLSNPNIFRITAPSTGTSPYLFMYGTDRLIKKANKQDSYAEGGVVDDTEPVDDETRRALL